MKPERINELVACCACREPMAGSRHTNFVALGLRATWEHPVAENLWTGRHGEAVAVVCDSCIESYRDILLAVEWEGDEVRYHPVDDLQALPPEPTYVMFTARSGVPAIKCLRCGMCSFHPDDIAQRYCGHCHEFHQRVTEESA